MASTDCGIDMCREHSGHLAVMQCQTCYVLVCVKCVSDRHKGHPMIGIEEVYKKEKAALQKYVEEMEHQDIPFVQQTLSITTQKKDEYKKKVATIRKEMENEFSELKAEVERIHKQRLEQLVDIENADLSIIEEIESKLRKQKREMKNSIADWRKRLTSSNKAELIMYTRQPIQHVQVSKDAMLPDVPQFQPLDIKSIKILDILGKLNTNKINMTRMPKQIVTPTIVSSFKTGLIGFTSICTTKDGNAWVGGFESNSLNLMDINGKVIRSRRINFRPYSLAMMNNEDIIMSPNSNDSNAVWRLRADGTEEMVYDASPSACRGVSVTRDQKILICTNDKRVMINIRDNTKQIYKGAGCIIHAIELPDKTICISDDSNKSLITVDMKGCVLRSITGPLDRTEFDPCGLAFDVMNNILTADSSSHSVYISCHKKKVRKLVGKSHGIVVPFWLSIDQYNNLWIGQGDEKVKVVQYLR